MAARGRGRGAAAPGGARQGAVPWNAREHNPRDLLSLSVKIKAPADGVRVSYSLNGHQVEYHVGGQWISQVAFNAQVEALNLATLVEKVLAKMPATDARRQAVSDAADVRAVKAAVGGEAQWRELFPND